MHADALSGEAGISPWIDNCLGFPAGIISVVSWPSGRSCRPPESSALRSTFRAEAIALLSLH